MRNCLNCCIQTMNTAEINGIFMRDLKMSEFSDCFKIHSVGVLGWQFCEIKRRMYYAECEVWKDDVYAWKDMGSEGQVYSKMWDRRTTEPANFC